MSLKKIFSVITLSAAFGAFGIAAMAQEAKTPENTDGKKAKMFKRDGKRGHHRRGGGKMMMREFRGLDLTDAQKAQMKTIFEANKPADGNRDEMRTLMKAKRDGSISADQQVRLDAIRQDQMQKYELLKQQIEAILTPEQKAKLEANRAEREKRRDQFRERRMERKNKTADGTN